MAVRAHRRLGDDASLPGDACDHFYRYPDDIALLAGLGFGAYRFSLEWSRIEPEEGEWSSNALDHYRRMIAACRDNGILPVVTFHHFTTPRWAAADGGWDNPAIVDRFAALLRARGRATSATRSEWVARSTSRTSCRSSATASARSRPASTTAPRTTGSTRTSRPRTAPAYDAIKSGPGDFPLGSCVAMGDWWSPEGSEKMLADFRHMHEGQHLEAARGDDFIGVQAYSRTRLTEHGKPLGAEEGVETLDMGYEYWPQALEAAIRYAADVTGNPIYVTENGIGTTDDTQRIRYVTDALAGVGRCLDDGIDVRGYFYWSLLDNFEWAFGYRPRFGLVGVDRETQVRDGEAQRHVARRDRPQQPSSDPVAARLRITVPSHGHHWCLRM